jgi:hypothetical protein
MRNQIFHSSGNEEAESAKILGDRDPPPPHWDLVSFVTFWVIAMYIQGKPMLTISNFSCMCLNPIDFFPI